MTLQIYICILFYNETFSTKENDHAYVCKKVRTLFPIHNKKKRQFLKKLSCAMEEYASENPDLTFDQLKEHFGTPQEIVHEYLSEMPEEELRRCLSIKKYVRICLGAILIVFIIAASVFSYSYYKAFQAVEDSIIYREETTI